MGSLHNICFVVCVLCVVCDFAKCVKHGSKQHEAFEAPVLLASFSVGVRSFLFLCVSVLVVQMCKTILHQEEDPKVSLF